MRERIQRSKFVIATGVVVGLVLLAACADAPTGAGAAPEVRAARVKSTGRRANTPPATADVAVLSVNTAKRQAFSLPGGHRISFPAQAICDLAASSYGPTEWDRPCAAQRGTVTITARVWTNAAGHPQVDFTPALRFDPRADAVILKMKDAYDSETGLGILYCGDDADSCVDESITDASLVTYSDRDGRAYSRRIKHFSGYNIASGRSIQGALE